MGGGTSTPLQKIFFLKSIDGVALLQPLPPEALHLADE